MEYLAINSDFLIVDTSKSVANFAEFPQACQIGGDVREAFPELVGLESVILEIIAQKTSFTLADVHREQDKTIYFNLHILSQHSSESCLILIQENTDQNLMVQQYSQTINQLGWEVEKISVEKQYYRTLCEHIDAILINTDQTGKIVEANQIAAQTFGFSRAELQTQKIQDLWLDSTKNQNIQQIMAIAQQKNVEIVCQSKTKETIYINFSCLSKNQYKLSETVWIGKDITHSKQSGIKLLQYTEKAKVFSQIVEALRQTQSLQSNLATVGEAIRQYLKCDRYIVYQLHSWQTGTILAEAKQPDLEPLQWQQVAKLLNLQPQCPTNYQSGKHCICYNHSDNQTVLVLSVPTPQYSQLTIAISASPRQWQPSEIEFLQQINSEIALAMLKTQLRQQIQQLTIVDDTTETANSLAFEHRLAQEWQRAVREQSDLALIMCEIDYFQLYQDNYGQTASRECLMAIATMLKTTARRPADFVARYRDHQFVLLLPSTNVNGAIIVAQQIQQHLQNLNIPHNYSPIADKVTLSLGVVSQIPARHSDCSQIVKAAIAALHQAKTNGRNRINRLQISGS